MTTTTFDFTEAGLDLRYFPGADITTQNFQTTKPGSRMVPTILLVHSTEGARWEPYEEGGTAPHLTLMIDSSKHKTCQWRQHFPFDVNSRALVNAAGGSETNKKGVIQVEVVATSGWASAENPSAPYKVALKIADLPDWVLAELGRLWAFLHLVYGVPLTYTQRGFVRWNAPRPTMSAEEWETFTGCCGHQHVPEGNHHTDPGALDIVRVLDHAKAFVRAHLAAGGAPAPAVGTRPAWWDGATPVPDPLVGVLTSHGMHNADALVAAAQATGVPLWIAAAFAEKESNGRNVYGNDVGGTFAGAGEVTEENFAEFYRLVVDEKQKSNGVGPMQITYPAYFPQARSEGLRLWVPLDNFTFGLRIIARNLGGDYSAESLQRVGTLYNKGNLLSGINPYGYDLAVKAAAWKQRLEPDSIPTPTPPAPTPTEPDPFQPVPPPPPPLPPSFDQVGTVLKYVEPRMRGEAVKVLQQRLTVHGIPTEADGVFGPTTGTNVKQFQETKGLTVDGVAGAATWAALLASPVTAVTEAQARADARVILERYGWRCNTELRLTQAIKDFQRMWAFGDALVIDGRLTPGTKTRDALAEMDRLGGKVSPNFKASEFACKCGGAYAACRRIWAHRELVKGAEVYRTLAGPFTPLSACRCTGHNKAVGGYYRSQHLHGTAMDLRAVYSLAKVKALNVFPAIGHNSDTAKTVRHVDFRNLSPDNFPYATGSTTNPYTYVYG